MPRKTERRHLQGDMSRQKILEAALDIAAERGYDGASVALVTERTGLPASSIYWHFKNKDQLLAEALDLALAIAAGARWAHPGRPTLNRCHSPARCRTASARPRQPTWRNLSSGASG